jgi:hypothetical protein
MRRSVNTERCASSCLVSHERYVICHEAMLEVGGGVFYILDVTVFGDRDSERESGSCSNAGQS